MKTTGLGYLFSCYSSPWAALEKINISDDSFHFLDGVCNLI